MKGEEPLKKVSIIVPARFVRAVQCSTAHLTRHEFEVEDWITVSEGDDQSSDEPVEFDFFLTVDDFRQASLYYTGSTAMGKRVFNVLGTAISWPQGKAEKTIQTHLVPLTGKAYLASDVVNLVIDRPNQLLRQTNFGEGLLKFMQLWAADLEPVLNPAG